MRGRSITDGTVTLCSSPPEISTQVFLSQSSAGTAQSEWGISIATAGSHGACLTAGSCPSYHVAARRIDQRDPRNRSMFLDSNASRQGPCPTGPAWHLPRSSRWTCSTRFTFAHAEWARRNDSCACRRLLIESHWTIESGWAATLSP